METISREELTTQVHQKKTPHKTDEDKLLTFIHLLMTRPKRAYIWAWHEALVERQSVLAAVDLGARGERGPHEVVDGVGGDVRERLLHAQQQVLHDHPVSAGNRQMTVVVVKPSSDRHTGPSSSRVYYSHLF